MLSMTRGASARASVLFATAALAVTTAGWVTLAPASASADPTMCDGQAATIVAQNPTGDTGVLTIQGTAGDDVIYVSDDGDYEILAGAGNDIVCGFPDFVDGGKGADTILGSKGPNRVTDFFGNNVVKTYGGNDHVDVNTGTVDTGSGDDVFGVQAFSTVRGVVVHLGTGDDRVVGFAGRGTFFGGAGDDRFLQTAPDDGDTMTATYVGGSGDDILAMHNDQIFSAVPFLPPVTIRSSDRVVRWVTPGSNRSNVLRYSAIETLRGGDGNDRFYGSAGRQWFEGGRGNDRMWGAGGNDTLLGDAGHDHAWGGPGRDRCRAEHRISCELR